MGRPRAFDHDLCRSLRAEGWTAQALADHFGVSRTSINRCVYPEYGERDNADARARLNALRRPCDNDCGTLVWGHMGIRSEDGLLLCLACRGLAAATTVRDDALLCTTCGEWKPDSAFPRYKSRARRGRHGQCTSCNTVTRRERNRKNGGSCATCGASITSASRTGKCHHCATTRRAAA